MMSKRVLICRNISVSRPGTALSPNDSQVLQDNAASLPSKPATSSLPHAQPENCRLKNCVTEAKLQCPVILRLDLLSILDYVVCNLRDLHRLFSLLSFANKSAIYSKEQRPRHKQISKFIYRNNSYFYIQRTSDRQSIFVACTQAHFNQVGSRLYK